MKDWFKKWFSSDEYLTVYSHRNEDDAENIINLILNNIELRDESRILDAACGAGRHSIILADRGFDVTAFDLSLNLLKIGQQNAREMNVNIQFLCSDIRYVTFKPAFDLVLNMFTSFGYFDNDYENFLFYKNAGSFLRQGGVIVLDYLNENCVRNNLVPQSRKRINGKEIVESRRIEDDRIIKSISITSDNTSHEYFEAVKLYDRNKILRSFGDLGFTPIFEAGDYFGSAFKLEESERLIIFFRKVK